MSGNNFDCHYWGVALGIWWVEATDPARHPPMHRTTLTESGFPVQNVNNVMVEQLCKISIVLSSYLQMRVGVQCSLAKWIGPINWGFSTTKTCTSTLSIKMEQWLRDVGLHKHQQEACSKFSFLDLPLEVLFCSVWCRTWNLHMLASRLLRGTVGEILPQTGVSLRGQCCFYCPCGWERVIWLLLLCSGFSSL